LAAQLRSIVSFAPKATIWLFRHDYVPGSRARNATGSGHAGRRRQCFIGLAVVLQRCNVIVVFAALRFGSASAWPDPAVTAVMAFIFLTSSMQILQQAWFEYFQQRVSASAAASPRMENCFCLP
jgi:hypothetical protein